MRKSNKSARPTRGERLSRLGGAQLLVEIDRRSSDSLQAQVYASIRRAILEKRLAADARLAPTRALADDLGVSRTTIVLAYDRLTAEGYVVSRGSAGSFVASLEIAGRGRAASAAPRAAATPRVSSNAQRIVEAAAASIGSPHVRSAPAAFRIGEPAYDLFPAKRWAKLYAKRARVAGSSLLGYGDPSGDPRLRAAIASYVGAARGVNATPEQVILTRGTQQAIDLSARLLLTEGDSAWVGDPGYLSARALLRVAGAKIVPVPSDDDGIIVEEGIRRAPNARLAYVSPSHQFPLGTAMSLQRRLALLEWAAASHAWVLEDDFDSEFRYTRAPIASLQGLDARERVIYMGTFSKTMFPSLRLGYLIVPRSLMEIFRPAQRLFDHIAPSVEQATLAEFIESGFFVRHVRRMRVTYAARQQSLVRGIERELPGILRVTPSDTGMHLVGWLCDRSLDDADVSRRALERGVEVSPLSMYAMRARLDPALLLGFAATRPIAMAPALRALRLAIEAAR